MPEKGIIKADHNDILRYEEIVKVVKAFSLLGIKKVRFTGGEPLIMEGFDKLVYETSKISSIDDIAITTNGILLGDMADKLKKAGLGRVNISLDTLKADKFSKITRGGDINKVLNAIEKSLSVGLEPVKLNIVLIKGINDDEIGDFIKLTKNEPLHVRFIELMPMGEGLKYYETGKISSGEVLENHPELIPVTEKSSGVAQIYKLENAKGSVGFISPLSHKFCSNCNRIRLTAAGTIKPCLHSRDEVCIKGIVNNEDLLLNTLKKAINSKPMEHHLEDNNGSESQKMMFQIGG
jgi:cyclic pyranopterin phosphate synthase